MTRSKKINKNQTVFMVQGDQLTFKRKWDIARSKKHLRTVLKTIEQLNESGEPYDTEEMLQHLPQYTEQTLYTLIDSLLLLNQIRPRHKDGKFTGWKRVNPYTVRVFYAKDFLKDLTE